MKKHLFPMFIGLCLSLVFFSTVAVADGRPTSGTCGENLTWIFEPVVNNFGFWEGGILTISGSGPMDNYDNVSSPWKDYPISTINIETGVTSIGNIAFYDCKYLSDITMPNTVTSIGDRAFSECSQLSDLKIPNSVTSIGSVAFGNCSGINGTIIIPNSVVSLGPGAFSGTSITEISIPSSVIRMDNIFDGCENLTEINVDINNRIYSSLDGALFNKEKTKMILCPKGKSSYNIPNGTVSIGEQAFIGCTKLANVTIPNSVTSISTRAFEGCSNLSNINIPEGVKSIDLSAFGNCSSLTRIRIPSSVVSIDPSAFYNCTSLTDVAIGEGVKIIGRGTFSYCTKLRNLIFPVSLVKIDSGAFEGCSGLKAISYSGSETQWGQIKIAEGNQELSLAKIAFNSAGAPTDPDTPNPPIDPDPPTQPTTPGTLALSVSTGGLGKKITVQITGGHWLTVQTRRAGSVALSSIQAPGSGSVTLAFSAAAGSSVQVWETETEMTFNAQGVPDNKILATASRTL